MSEVKRYQYITPEDYEIARKNGITVIALTQRVYTYGWDIDSAITKPLGERLNPALSKETLALAEKNGVHKEMLYRRIHTQGWDEVRAATTPPKKPRTVFSPEYLAARKIAEENGINRNAFNQRIYKMKWSLEKASTTPIQPRGGDLRSEKARKIQSTR